MYAGLRLIQEHFRIIILVMPHDSLFYHNSPSELLTSAINSMPRMAPETSFSSDLTLLSDSLTGKGVFPNAWTPGISGYSFSRSRVLAWYNASPSTKRFCASSIISKHLVRRNSIALYSTGLSRYMRFLYNAERDILI